MPRDGEQASALYQGADENDIVPVAEEDREFDIRALNKRIRELEEIILRGGIPVKEEESVRPRVKTETAIPGAARNPETPNKSVDTDQLVSALQRIVPGNTGDTKRIINPLKRSSEGIALERWEKQVLQECQFLRITDDRDKIMFALKHTDESIHRHFNVIDPNKWSWETFRGCLKTIAPLQSESNNARYLSRTS